MDMPKSNGICFDDAYVNDKFENMIKARHQNCYLKLPYKLNVSQNDIIREGYSLKDYVRKLNGFVQSYYYKSGSYLTLKLALLKLAINGVNTGKMIFLIGSGGDGKGMEAILDRNILGENNCTTLDCGIFTERLEFRRSGHFGWNKVAIRIQEFNNDRRIISDIWKRFVSGEDIDLRVNYGFTVKLSFGSSMKIQELNYECIPIIEEKTSCTKNDEYCNQLKRRVICAKIGKGTLVHNPEEVNHEEGMFLYIPQDELEEFLSDKVTASLFFKYYCMPFFKKYSLDDCKKMVNNLDSIDNQLELDTVWLAKKLSGIDNDITTSDSPSLHIESEENTNTSHAIFKANDIIANVHSAMPDHLRMIKQFRIHRCPLIPVSRGPEKGKKGSPQIKKALKFDELIEISNLKLFKKIPKSDDYDMLVLNYKKFVICYEKYGGVRAFGDWNQWGDTFEYRTIQQPWIESQENEDKIVLQIPTKRKMVRQVRLYNSTSV